MLPARHRLRRAADFQAAVHGPGGSRSGGRLVVVHANRSEARVDLPPRVGFVVSGAVGGAVRRNRTKRVLRALVAQRLNGIPTGTDLVVRAQPAAVAATAQQLGVELDRHLVRVSAAQR